MQTLFSPDSKFMIAMGRVCDLLMLNFLFLITSIPVFTIGASATALYTVCFRFDTEREQGVFKSYFRAFRDNFRQSTVIWLIFLLWGGTACLNTFLFYSLADILRWFAFLFAVLLVLAVLIAGCAFPLLSQFSNSIRSTLQNALILSIGYLPRSILIAVINSFPLVLLICNMYLFLQVGFIWVAIYFSAAGYINTLLLKKVFAPYITCEEESA